MNETTSPPLISARSPAFIWLAVLSCVSGFVAIVGNAVVLVAIYRTKALHTISNFFIASLAVADMVVGILLNPLLSAKTVIFSYRNPDLQIRGSVFDKVEDFAWIQAVVATTFGLTAISVDRYIAVNFGLRYEALSTPKHCALATASVWITSLVFASVRLFIDNRDHLSILWVVMGIITCILPFIIITFCYVQIFKAAKRQVQKINQVNSLTRPDGFRRKNTQVSHTRTAYTVAIVIVLFIVLWAPSLITAVVQVSLAGSQMPKNRVIFTKLERVAWPWVCFVAYLSSAVNPWIYSIRSRQFRLACTKIFKCFGRLRPRDGPEIMSVTERGTTILTPSSEFCEPNME